MQLAPLLVHQSVQPGDELVILSLKREDAAHIPRRGCIAVVQEVVTADRFLVSVATPSWLPHGDAPVWTLAFVRASDDPEIWVAVDHPDAMIFRLS